MDMFVEKKDFQPTHFPSISANPWQQNGSSVCSLFLFILATIFLQHMVLITHPIWPLPGNFVWHNTLWQILKKKNIHLKNCWMDWNKTWHEYQSSNISACLTKDLIGKFIRKPYREHLNGLTPNMMWMFFIRCWPSIVTLVQIHYQRWPN